MTYKIAFTALLTVVIVAASDLCAIEAPSIRISAAEPLNSISHIRLSTNQKLLIAGGTDSEGASAIGLWRTDPLTQVAILTINAQLTEFLDLAISEDQSRALVASRFDVVNQSSYGVNAGYSTTLTAQLYDFDDPGHIEALWEASDLRSSGANPLELWMHVAPDTRNMLICTAPGTLKLITLLTSAGQVNSLSATCSIAKPPVFSFDSKFALIEQITTMLLLDIESGRSVSLADAHDVGTSVFTFDSRNIVTPLKSGGLGVFDVSNGRKTSSILRAASDVRDVLVMPNNQQVIVQHGAWKRQWQDASLRNSSDGAIYEQLADATIAFSARNEFNPDARGRVNGNNDIVSWWDPERIIIQRADLQPEVLVSWTDIRYISESDLLLGVSSNRIFSFHTRTSAFRHDPIANVRDRLPPGYELERRNRLCSVDSINLKTVRLLDDGSGFLAMDDTRAIVKCRFDEDNSIYLDGLQLLPSNNGTVNTFATTPDGSTIATINCHTLIVARLADAGACQTSGITVTSEHAPTGIALSSDGNYLYYIDIGGSIYSVSLRPNIDSPILLSTVPVGSQIFGLSSILIGIIKPDGSLSLVNRLGQVTLIELDWKAAIVPSALTSSGQYFTFTKTGLIQFYDATFSRLLCQMRMNSKGWLGITSGGLFDFGTLPGEAAEQIVNPVSIWIKDEPYPLSRVRSVLFQPGIMSKSFLNGVVTPLELDPYRTLPPPPRIETSWTPVQNEHSGQLNVRINVKITAPATLSELRLFVNGRIYHEKRIAQTTIVAESFTVSLPLSTASDFNPDSADYYSIVAEIVDSAGLRYSGREIRLRERDINPQLIRMEADVASESTDHTVGKLHFVSIGVNNYGSFNRNVSESRELRGVNRISSLANAASSLEGLPTNLPNLSFAVADAKSMIERISNKWEESGFTLGLQLSLADPRQVDSASIGTALKQVQAEAHEDDTVVIFFAGHGVASTSSVAGLERPEFYLMTASAGQIEQLPSQAIAITSLFDVLLRVKAKSIIVIIDACQSGIATDNFLSQFAAGFRFLELESGISVLAGAGGDQAAEESLSLGHGLFTWSVLRSFDDIARNTVFCTRLGRRDSSNSPFVPLSSVAEAIREHLKTQSELHSSEQGMIAAVSSNDPILARCMTSD